MNYHKLIRFMYHGLWLRKLFCEVNDQVRGGVILSQAFFQSDLDLSNASPPLLHICSKQSGGHPLVYSSFKQSNANSCLATHTPPHDGDQLLKQHLLISSVCHLQSRDTRSDQ